jgi:hypothetical protein
MAIQFRSTPKHTPRDRTVDAILSKEDFEDAVAAVNMTLADIAKQTGVNRQYLSEFKCGDRNLRAEMRQTLRDFFEARPAPRSKKARSVRRIWLHAMAAGSVSMLRIWRHRARLARAALPVVVAVAVSMASLSVAQGGRWPLAPCRSSGCRIRYRVFIRSSGKGFGIGGGQVPKQLLRDQVGMRCGFSFGMAGLETPGENAAQERFIRQPLPQFLIDSFGVTGNFRIEEDRIFVGDRHCQLSIILADDGIQFAQGCGAVGGGQIGGESDCESR